jgi:hypothetical protein
MSETVKKDKYLLCGFGGDLRHRANIAAAKARLTLPEFIRRAIETKIREEENREKEIK